jgi:surface carbohydrate biosynthesis protein
MLYQSKAGKDTDFLIFVEHKDRELEISAYLANLLESSGYSVTVASTLYHQIPSLINIRPRVVVTPSTCFGRGSVAELFYSCYGESITYVNLNYEQFISSWKGRYKTSNHAFSRNGQIQFVWGEYFKNELISNGINQDNIFVTGRPSLDVIKRQYTDVSKNDLIKDSPFFKDKDICFIALTDGLAFVDQKKIDFIVSNGADRDGLENHVSYVKENIKHMLFDLTEVATRRRDVIFVIRPHPSIPEEAYTNLFKKYNLDVGSNVIISKEKSAYWWLALSDYYVTNYSTLCLEAKVLGKQSFLYEKVSNENVESYWYTATAKTISDFDEVFACSYTNCENKVTTKSEPNANSNFFIDFDKNGLQESADRLIQIHKPGNVTKTNSIWAVLYKNKRRMLGSIVRNFYARIGFVPFGRVSKGILKDYFTSKDVLLLMKAVKK